MSEKLYDLLSSLKTEENVEDLSDRAFTATRKLFIQIRSDFKDDTKMQELLWKAWIRAINNNDLGKFIKVYKRHRISYRKSKGDK